MGMNPLDDDIDHCREHFIECEFPNCGCDGMLEYLIGEREITIEHLRDALGEMNQDKYIRKALDLLEGP